MQPEGFICNKCGDCCRGFSDDFGVVVFPYEVDDLANDLKIEADVFVTKYCNAISIEINDKPQELYMLRHIDGRCVFLDGNDCTIHHAKPIQCKNGPFGFFWDGDRRFDCMVNVDVPKDWESTKNDIKIIIQLNTQEYSQIR